MIIANKQRYPDCHVDAMKDAFYSVVANRRPHFRGGQAGQGKVEWGRGGGSS